jgi:hypothetical protein
VALGIDVKRLHSIDVFREDDTQVKCLEGKRGDGETDGGHICEQNLGISLDASKKRQKNVARSLE